MRTFGIKQLAAALAMVGEGEQFIDQQFAIGFALKIVRQRLSDAEREELTFDGMQYMVERGILALDVPPKPKFGNVDVVIRLSSAEVLMTKEPIAAGLKPRSIGSEALIIEFKGRLPRDSNLIEKVRQARGTAVFIENPHLPEAPGPAASTVAASEEPSSPAVLNEGPVATEPEPSEADNQYEQDQDLREAEEGVVAASPSAHGVEPASSDALLARVGITGASPRVLDDLTDAAARIGKYRQHFLGSENN